MDGQTAAAPAIIDDNGRRFSYGELTAMTLRAADALATLGVRAGDRVLLISENSAEYAVALLAINRLGAWLSPVNARHTATEIKAIADHAGARALVFTTGASANAARHGEEWRATVIAETEAGPLTVAGAFKVEPEPCGPDAAQNVAALIYTTGTTSAPKGVMLTNANLIWNAQTSSQVRGITADDEVLSVLPGTHIFGFSSVVLGALSVGATLRFIACFSPEAVLDALAAGVSVFPTVPNMFERILTHMERTGQPLSAPRLKYISAGGAPLDTDWKARTEKVFGLPLHNGYGITETSPGIATTLPSAPRHDLSAGPPVPGVTVRVENPDEQGVGELIIQSPGVMKGYYRNEAETQRVLLPDGWFCSGDMGRVEEDGAITVLGRAKELIVRSGFNVYPPEIEAMLTQDPEVLQAAVVGRPVKGNEEIIAFIIAPGAETSKVAERLRAHLTPYKVPQRIIKVDAFPAAPTGKVLRHKLLSHFAETLAADRSD